MSNHTPGPWYLESDSRYRMSHIDVRHGNNSAGAPSGVIAKVTCRVSWAKEQTANARLIAAAPDLLDLAREITDNVILAGMDIGHRAREIIAKATGESND